MSDDQRINAVYPEEVEQAHAEEQDKAQLQRLRFAEDLEETFGSESGARVLDWIFSDSVTGLHRDTFTGNSKGMKLQGMQEVGRILQDALLYADPEIMLNHYQRRADAMRDEEE